ncbi:phosphate/phosphite/phosphonate ABC transporter substrate-binding protein [Erysipelothrix sp. HDW6B]|uniref:phosphate/phosphite/phosphonate ABC transporter substrate-binding protein n=1 Tax=Erysipelothrix TaxID=1647 RepID=UPI001356B8B8|nr:MULTISPECIES: phosphate/phosphite/phosphonate ABC transporter substrate-binding protein [Erysipelothrix]QIK86919.1 phosphate/phosphite/phosphonate ABC transporter substrate-binding protein [Erysipelothrix sp. HDW6B]
MKISKIIAGGLALFALVGCSSQAQDSFTIAYLPVEDSMAVQELNTAFQEDLSKAINMEVKSYQTTSYSAAIEAVSSGKVDMVQLTPFSYVVARNKGGVSLVANVEMPSMANDNGYVACFITSQGSDIQSLDDVKGKTIAFGDPASTTGHLIPKYKLLVESGVPLETLESSYFKQIQFSGGHDKTVIGVAQGTYDVGATYCQMPQILEENGVIDKDSVRVIGGAGSELGVDISAVPVVVREDLDATVKQQVQDFLLAYSNPDYFKNLGMKGGKYGAPNDALYDGLETMSKELKLTEEAMSQ